MGFLPKIRLEKLAVIHTNLIVFQKKPYFSKKSANFRKKKWTNFPEKISLLAHSMIFLIYHRIVLWLRMMLNNLKICIFSAALYLHYNKLHYLHKLVS